MYQITILFQGAEIGYGEGESYKWARDEAVQSVSDFYLGSEDQWQLSVVKSC